MLGTSDGEYRCRFAVFAVGVAEPFKPSTPGFGAVPHYVDTRAPETYADKRLVIVGKQNSGFELATGLLQWCRQIVLVSPRPAQPSFVLHSLAGVRARYVLPFEDATVGGGVFLMNASIDRVDRVGEEWHVQTRAGEGATPFTIEADEVIAATGFVCPLQDLPQMGVATFGQSRLPAQSPYWESATVPGIFFTGTIGQGAAGLRKYGHPSNSGAVHGARYNARIVARTIGERLGVATPGSEVAPDGVVEHLLNAATSAPELWNQKAYLASVVSVSADGSARDEGIHPLQDFVDREDLATEIAMTVEIDDKGAIYPFVYVRHRGSLHQEALEGHPLNDYTGAAYRARLGSLLAGAIGKHVVG